MPAWRIDTPRINKSRRRCRARQSRTTPYTVRYAFMNKAG